MIIQEQAVTKDGGIEDRATPCNHVIELARTKRAEIATSGLSLAEVCKHKDVKAFDGDTLTDFFRNDYILIVAVDRYVGTLARELMQGGHGGLKPPDAVHLATALIAHAAQFHTYDDTLLKLDGKLQKPDGGLLKICKPFGPPPDLLSQL